MRQAYLLSAAFTFLAIFIFAVLSDFFQLHFSVIVSYALAAGSGFLVMALPVNLAVKLLGGSLV